MAFGILEDTRLEHVPGTALLQVEGISHMEGPPSRLKRGTGRNAHVVLVPQPSNDPNDPLNWPLWQRDLIFLLLSAVLAETFDVSFTKISLLTGYTLCAVGACGVFVSAVANKYGKRPVLLFSLSCSFAGTIWGGASNSYNSLLGARVLQGCGVAMFESVMFAVTGDLYFVHERGSRMSFLTIATTGLANTPAMLSGLATQNLGWKWVFWLLAIFVGIALVLVIFFGWETAYNREAIYNTDTSSTDNLQIIESMKRQDEASHIEEVAVPAASSPVGEEQLVGPRRSLWKRTIPFSGPYSDHDMLKEIARPFAILVNLVVLWSALIISFPTLWITVIAFVVAQIFSAPPFLLSTTEIGCLNAGPAIGGTIGCLMCMVFTDPASKWMAKRNNGIYEPEFRLLTMIPLFIFSMLGYFMFGNLIEKGVTPVASAVIWGIVYCGLAFSYVAVGSYMVDAYRDISIEVFIIGMVLKNFLFFGFLFFLNDWIAKWGPAKTFNTIGGLQAGICLSTVPLWIYSKRVRASYHANNLLKKLNI
ncbi:hypothetical protein OIDMADRAFT_46215 [Oidiodendron maius Zn]|uniref:Major facilitator superfamily (MFS) profile domain-containing protein n=1 Tax=Oidiodendron maius (strain Zn) TaxID=913774 RepID=A0A0C3CUL0_OIDMZ|nr:hypothetical protein OIDMADRAFT_46215 [Oidiodendron maius Zn]